MTLVNPRTKHRVSTVNELIDVLDIEDHQEEIKDKIKDTTLLTEPVILEAIKRANGDFLWDYTHEDHQNIEVTIYELPPTTWETVGGVPYEEIKDIDKCPECGHRQFYTVKSEKKTGSIHTDDFAMIDEKTADDRFNSLVCMECDHTIVQDGELQH